MSEYTKLFERAAARYPEPDLSMDDVLLHRDHKRRNQRIGAGMVGIAVFVAAIWVVTTGGPFDRTQTPIPGGGGTGPATPPPHPVGVGLQGIPPEGAIPSTPEHGELVVGFSFADSLSDSGGFSLHVYADGRVIWRDWVEQRLTPRGVELIRSEVLSTGLFDGDLHLAGGLGLLGGEATVRDGDLLERITWGYVETYDGPTTSPTPEQADAITHLNARLRDLMSWLPSSAWADPEPKPFVPSRYVICYATGPGAGFDDALDPLPRAAAEVLRSLDLTFEVSDPPGSTPNGGGIWCSTLTMDQARSLATILDDADTPHGVIEDVLGVLYEYGPRDPGETNLALWLRPMLPHQQFSDEGWWR